MGPHAHCVIMRSALLKRTSGEPHFRWRGTNISRVENLSDAIFGFAITLLVVSLQVPATFAELKGMLGQFVPFGLCVAVFGMIWHLHYKFFRRYGLEDATTMLLNAVLLFVLLFYLYPLKFLVQLLYNAVTGRISSMQMTWSDSGHLLLIYSLGYALVFGLLAALYRHAWRCREVLQLEPSEELVTRQAQALLMVHVVTGLVVAAASQFTSFGGLFGFLYFFIGPASYIVGSHYEKKLQALSKPPIESVAVAT
jgi:uncharacterized membrane protein